MCFNCHNPLTFIYSFFEYPLDKLKPLHYGQSDETYHLCSRCQTSTSQKSSAFWKRDFGIRHDQNHITMKVLILTRYKLKPGWAIKLNHNLEDWHIQLSIYEKWTIQRFINIMCFKVHLTNPNLYNTCNPMRNVTSTVHFLQANTTLPIRKETFKFTM